jgi:hypothetical protein
METHTLRFAVGARVCCRTGQNEWSSGTVVKLWYREGAWPAWKTAPYQVKLDDGHLIFAPQDSDELIRDEARLEELLYEEASANEAATAAKREDIISRYPRKHPAIFATLSAPRPPRSVAEWRRVRTLAGGGAWALLNAFLHRGVLPTAPRRVRAL